MERVTVHRTGGLILRGGERIIVHVTGLLTNLKYRSEHFDANGFCNEGVPWMFEHMSDWPEADKFVTFACG